MPSKWLRLYLTLVRTFMKTINTNSWHYRVLCWLTDGLPKPKTSCECWLLFAKESLTFAFVSLCMTTFALVIVFAIGSVLFGLTSPIIKFIFPEWSFVNDRDVEFGIILWILVLLSGVTFSMMYFYWSVRCKVTSVWKKYVETNCAKVKYSDEV